MKRELTYPEIRQILALRRRGLSLRVIADMFERCHRTIWLIEKRFAKELST